MKSETIEGIKLVNIPSGSFLMGHVYKYEPGIPERVNRYYPDELPVFKVSVKDFQLGETQVTQAQYQKIAGENFSTFKGDDLPITNLGPAEIIKFCNKLSAAAGLKPCYDERTRKCDFTKNGFRMPTEKEWEYSCRAGTTNHFYNGNTEKDLARAGWYIGNSDGKTHPVAQKEPNSWGLFDMHGNVFEFCDDNWIPNMCYCRYLPEGGPKPIFDYYHALNITRGGGWFSEPSVCRSAARACFCSWERIHQSYYMGFRVARSLV
jgi:formylglycine-generating enzyme required for sulfatase activity